MAAASIFRVLLVAVIARSRSESTNGYNHNNGKAASQFGELLKPPPPPLLSNIVPVPFHGGSSRSQRQNLETGYIYQPPPPPPPPLPPSSDFKFPSPFYKQYNFNFVPPPQPFTTTPAPSLFQKVSGWLFSSQQTNYESAPIYNNNNNIAPVKKDCNPCNLVPWIPVLRYNLGGKNIQQNLIPTYGPPSPTAYAPNVAQFRPQPFLSQDQRPAQLRPGIPHAVYGPPPQSIRGNSVASLSSTYGPPSPTHTLAVPSPSPPTSTYSFDSSSFSIPSSSYGVPSSSVGQSSSAFVPSSSYGVPSSSFGQLSPSYGIPSSAYGAPSSTYGPPTSTFGTPSPTYVTPLPATSTFSSPSPNFEVSSINNDLPHQSDIDVFRDIEPSNELQLPKVTHPTGFKNSYGEPISNTYAINNIPYAVSASGAESTKIQTEVLPTDGQKPQTSNASLALANPAPFSLNRGRNIHTLQPVALPNLSVSPLPPIFNARPFRPITANPFIKNVVQDLNSMQQSTKNVHIDQSVPLAEYTHSIDYPATVIKSSLIDIDASKSFNQTKAYRNIPNGFLIDEIRDISSQASEDHVEATKSHPDSSFETTGADFGNDLYDTPIDLKRENKLPSNHKTSFADLRGIKDTDVDKFRTESNLQNIDSPLLYLKPSAPHKDHGNFVFAISTPGTGKDYEIYDDTATTAAPQSASAWDESRTDYSEGLLSPPRLREDNNKPKIVQIIVPYTTGQQNGQNSFDFDNNIPGHWTPTPEDEYQARKVPPNTESPYLSTVTESYTTASSTDDSSHTVTESYDERLNTQAILNDLYDVKEPPFDIIKLQHTIDDWTEQEYSSHYKYPQKSRTSAKYAKQIPDEYFTTLNPITNYVTAATNYYEFYDHEGSSSIQHSITDNGSNKNNTKPRKDYNTIERTKAKHISAKNEEKDEGKKPHIYTAASSFRSTTTTPAPWETIQTSISPLTKEKVYVVTSKPWRDTSNEKTKEWYDVEQFESQKTNADNDVIGSDNLPFKSPRFPNRPSFGFPNNEDGQIEAVKPDSSYAFSKSWHQSINDLENQTASNSTILPGGSDQTFTTNSYAEENNVPNMEEDTTTTTTTAEPLEEEMT